MQTETSYDTVFDAQQHFRLLLDSMSRPGKINTFRQADILPPKGLNQSSAFTGFALLNADTTFYAAGPNQNNIASYFLINTGSRQAEISEAEYIFLPEWYGITDLHEAQVGTSIYPENSATLIAAVKIISEKPFENALALTLKGPGVNGEAVVFIDGINAELLDFLHVQNAEYPLGIDLIITDSENHVLCIPRSNKFTHKKIV